MEHALASANTLIGGGKGLHRELRDALLGDLGRIKATELSKIALKRLMLADLRIVRVSPDDLRLVVDEPIKDICVPAGEAWETMQAEDSRGPQSLTDLILLLSQHANFLSKYPPSTVRVFTYDSCSTGLSAEDRGTFDLSALRTCVPGFEERAWGEAWVDVAGLSAEYAEMVLGVECEVRDIRA